MVISATGRRAAPGGAWGHVERCQARPRRCLDDRCVVRVRPVRIRPVRPTPDRRVRAVRGGGGRDREPPVRGLPRCPGPGRRAGAAAGATATGHHGRSHHRGRYGLGRYRYRAGECGARPDHRRLESGVGMGAVLRRRRPAGAARTSRRRSRPDRQRYGFRHRRRRPGGAAAPRAVARRLAGVRDSRARRDRRERPGAAGGTRSCRREGSGGSRPAPRTWDGAAVPDGVVLRVRRCRLLDLRQHGDRTRIRRLRRGERGVVECSRHRGNSCRGHRCGRRTPGTARHPHLAVHDPCGRDRAAGPRPWQPRRDRPLCGDLRRRVHGRVGSAGVVELPDSTRAARQSVECDGVLPRRGCDPRAAVARCVRGQVRPGCGVPCHRGTRGRDRAGASTTRHRAQPNGVRGRGRASPSRVTSTRSSYQHVKPATF